MIQETSLNSCASPSTSRRLRVVLAFVLFVIAGKIEVTGLEQAREAARKSRLIIVTTHISNLDMLAALHVLAPLFDLRTVNKSLQHSFVRRPMEYLAMCAAGRRNFLPISYLSEERLLADGRRKTHERPLFVRADFEPMRRVLEQGKTVMIAAHNPAEYWKLPARSGYGAVYLAQITRDAHGQPATLLPVTIDVQSAEPAGSIDIAPNATWRKKMRGFFKRPAVRIHIHPTISLAPINGIEHSNQIRSLVTEQSEKIMRILASALPPEKRGPF